MRKSATGHLLPTGGQGGAAGDASQARAGASPSRKERLACPQEEEGQPPVWEGDYVRLKEAINVFNTQIDQQIAKNDYEFLAAYRSHMQQVQKELEAMKKKMNECEFIIKKDERVRKLQA